jgi:hypothetical protein
MPTLDTRGVVVNKLLKINYDDLRIPDGRQTKRLVEVVKLASEWSRLALRTLRRIANPPYDPDPIVRRILESHFRLPPITRGSTQAWSDDLRFIISNFQRIWLGLSGSLTISDSYSVYLKAGLQIRGYTMTKPGHIRGVPSPESYGSIHLDFSLLKNESSKLMMITMLIHEAGHKFCSMWDTCYRNERRYSNLSPNSLRMNPDSYAFTAVSIFKRQCITQLWGYPSVGKE